MTQQSSPSYAASIGTPQDDGPGADGEDAGPLSKLLSSLSFIKQSQFISYVLGFQGVEFLCILPVVS